MLRTRQLQQNVSFGIQRAIKRHSKLQQSISYYSYNKQQQPLRNTIISSNNLLGVTPQRNYHVLQQTNIRESRKAAVVNSSSLPVLMRRYPNMSIPMPIHISLKEDILPNQNNNLIPRRNYIFFETNTSKFQKVIDSALSLFGLNNPINRYEYTMQQRKKVMIRLKNNTKEQMKSQMERLRLRLRYKAPRNRKSVTKRSYKSRFTSTRRSYDTNRTKFKQWRRKNQSILVTYYTSKRCMIKHRTQDMWKRLRTQRSKSMKQISSMRDWVDWVTIHEPFQKEWFTNHGYPLTSIDPRTDRFVNPWKSESTNGWKRIEEVWRWKKSRFIGYDLKHSVTTPTNNNTTTTTNTNNNNNTNGTKTIENEKSNEIQPSTIPIQLSPPSSSDKIKLTWVGHATMLVQMSGFTIITDPVFSRKASPVQYFSESEFFGVPRRLPPSFEIDDIPSHGVDVCLISHDHYDHLDYDSVIQLTTKNLVKYWVVPLGMKEWLMNEAGVDEKKIVELEWWQSVKFKKNTSNSQYFSKDNEIQTEKIKITKVMEWSNPVVNLESNLESLLTVDDDHTNIHSNQVYDDDDNDYDDNHNDDDDNNEMVITCAPAQHWCSRTPFDRNTRLWCSWAIHSTASVSPSVEKKDEEEIKSKPKSKSNPKQLSFYFAGDTGYPKSFPLHRQIGDRLGPFDLSAIPIGAYKPRFFMHDSHCDPFESVKIHKDIRSRKSVAIHWGTFPLANEPYDEPPQLLKEAVNLESAGNDGEKVDFISMTQGNTIESKSL